jgi:hypothetical protein
LTWKKVWVRGLNLIFIFKQRVLIKEGFRNLTQTTPAPPHSIKMAFGYGMNENQNHLVAEGRTTSRVLSEPGGKSSLNLGWDSPKNSSELPLNAFARMAKLTNNPISLSYYTPYFRTSDHCGG